MALRLRSNGDPAPPRAAGGGEASAHPRGLRRGLHRQARRRHACRHPAGVGLAARRRARRHHRGVRAGAALALGQLHAPSCGPARWTNGFGWLQTDENYRYIRLLFEQGRIIAIKGNMPRTRRCRRSPAPRARWACPSASTTPRTPRSSGSSMPPVPRERAPASLRRARRHLADPHLPPVPQVGLALALRHPGGLHAQERIVLPGYANVWSFMEERQQVGAHFSTASASASSSEAARSHARYLDSP